MRKLAPLFAAVSLVMVLLLALVGCGPSDKADAADPATSSEEPTPQHGGILTIAVQDDASSLDPHQVTDAASMRLIENLYSTLLRYDPESVTLRPDLASSVKPSEDGLSYTIKLRDDAAFPSGRSVTSQDVAYSIRRIREMKVRAQHFDAVTEIQTPEEHTVVLRLDQPVAPLPSYLAYPMNAIVDREVVEAHEGSLKRADAGCGPFRLVEWRTGDRLIMEADPGFYEADLPYLDRVVFRPMPDETARATAIRTGEVDMVLDVAAKDRKLLDRADGVRVESVPGTFWEYLGMNCQAPPLDDPRVRRAIATALDRAQLNQLVKLGTAHVLDGGPIPPNHWCHPGLAIYPEPDLDVARDLLAEAGHAQGFELTLKTGSAFPYQVRAAEVIKQQLEPLGITVQLQALESSVFFSDLGSGEFQLTVVGWVGFVDPDEYTWNLFHSDGKWNQQGFSDSRVDELLERGKRSLDRDERREIYRDAIRRLCEQAPVAFLYVNEQATGLRNSVHGYRVHPTASTRSLRRTFRQ